MHKCQNKSVGNVSHLEQMVDQFFPYSQKQLGFDQPVIITFQSDDENASKMLGKTAYYDPGALEVVLYTDNRHPKDIMRSLSHELVHHAQNCRGDFGEQENLGAGYAQEDPHLRKMEREAYTKGNLIFRDFEDLIKTGKINIEIDFSDSGEPKMSLKEWKNNEINTKLMKKWGFLKEGLEAFASAEEEDETSGAPASDAADLDEKHDHPGESCEEAHPGASHEKFEAGLRGQGGGPGDEHYQFDKKEREGELEETGMSYRDDDDPTGRPTRRYDNPITALTDKDYEGIGSEESDDEEGNRPSMAADMDIQGGRVTEPASARLGKRRRSRGGLGSGVWNENTTGKISVREAKEITRRIIERIKKEGK